MTLPPPARPRRSSSDAMPSCGRRRQALFVALIPLTCLSVAWTVQLATPTELIDVASEGNRLPDGGAVPIEALDDPANFTIPGQLALGVKGAHPGEVVAASSTNGIPSAALAAYQRAETVINAADKSCNADWHLIAAIGRVESDHGRYGGNVLSTDGVSRPGIYGIPLNGTNNTQAITDTDAGQYDRDKVWDRAVGPMQFIPSTWSVVGVDADGDGERNPQSINDAALAAAAYLCSGADDLGTDDGRRAAVFRYNHSRAYVDLVLQIREAFLEGDYVAVPDYTASAVTFLPYYGPVTGPRPPKRAPGVSAPNDSGSTGGGSRGGGSASDGSTAPEGAGGGADEPSGTDGEGGDTTTPVRTLQQALEDTAKDPARVVQKTTEEVTQQVVDPVLTLAQATLKCTAAGYNALLTPRKWRACLNDLTT